MRAWKMQSRRRGVWGVVLWVLGVYFLMGGIWELMRGPIGIVGVVLGLTFLGWARAVRP